MFVSAFLPILHTMIHTKFVLSVKSEYSLSLAVLVQEQSTSL